MGMVLLIVYLVIGFLISCLCLRSPNLDNDIDQAIEKAKAEGYTVTDKLSVFVRWFASVVIGLLWLPCLVFKQVDFKAL